MNKGVLVLVLIVTFLAAGSLFASAVLLLLLKADTDRKLFGAKGIGYDKFYERKDENLPPLALAVGVTALLLSLLAFGLFALVCAKGCNLQVPVGRGESKAKVSQPQKHFLLHKSVHSGPELLQDKPEPFQDRREEDNKLGKALLLQLQAGGDMKDTRKVLLVNRKEVDDLHSTLLTGQVGSDSHYSCYSRSHGRSHHSNVLSPYEYYAPTPTPNSPKHRRAYPALELRATKKSAKSHKGGGGHKGSHKGGHGKSHKGPSGETPKTHMQKTMEGTAGHNTPSAMEQGRKHVGGGGGGGGGSGHGGVPGGLSLSHGVGGGGGFSVGVPGGGPPPGQAIHQVAFYMNYSVSTLIEQYDTEIARLEALLALLKKERAELINAQMSYTAQSAVGAGSVASRTSSHASSGASCVVQVQDTPSAYAPAAPTTPYEILKGSPPAPPRPPPPPPPPPPPRPPPPAPKSAKVEQQEITIGGRESHGHHAAHQISSTPSMMPVAPMPMPMAVPVPVPMQPMPIQPVVMGAGRASHHGGPVLTCACDMHKKGHAHGAPPVQRQPQGPGHRVPLFRPKVRLGVKDQTGGAKPGFSENFHSIVKTELIKVAQRPSADAATFDWQRAELINRIKSGDIIL